MKSFFSVSFIVAAIPFVLGHGILTDPPPRQAGTAMAAVCGEQVTNNQKSDNGGNVEGLLQVAASQKDYDATKCNLFLCKGYQAADNTANVQTYSPGQVVPIKAAIKAPHTGSANVSVVDTKTNALIGQPLIVFDDYASTKHTIPANNTAFSITMPPEIAGKCAAAGDCVVQWFWFSPEAKQTYESCIDFTTGGGAPPKVKQRQIVATDSTVSQAPKTTMTISAMSGGEGGEKTESESKTGGGKKSTSTEFQLTGTAASATSKATGSGSKASSTSASTTSAAVVQSNDSDNMNVSPLVKFSVAWSVTLSLLALL